MDGSCIGRENVTNVIDIRSAPISWCVVGIWLDVILSDKESSLDDQGRC